MIENKPILNIDDQIKHLKNKGVTFELINEDEAKNYLKYNNNYFKLTSYRKNYDKHPDGQEKGKYINLDFAYLKDLAIIDMNLRYKIVHIALDIEHHTRLEILNKAIDCGEDGYQIVKDYMNSLDKKRYHILESEINRNIGSVYCGGIVDKYDKSYPIWAFLEIIPFGGLISFYRFCADRFNDKEMLDNYYRLLTCKEIRNAAAHSNSILNDLRSNTCKHDTNGKVTKELAEIQGISSEFRKNRMSNARIQQIVTLLYMHKTMVMSDGISKYEADKLKALLERFYLNISFYKTNDIVKNTFDFLKLVIDNWFNYSNI